MIQAYISYASGDKETADKLVIKLKDYGLDVASVESIRVAEPILEAARTTISNCDLFFALISSKSEHSQWVVYESTVALSLADRKQGRPLIVPVLVGEHTQIPFFFQHINVIKYSDLLEGRQHDTLIVTVKSNDSARRDRAKELANQAMATDLARETIIRKLLLHDMTTRVARSSTVRASMTALITMSFVLAILISIAASYNILAITHWILPFGAGVLISIIGTQTWRWQLRRIMKCDPNEKKV